MAGCSRYTAGAACHPMSGRCWGLLHALPWTGWPVPSPGVGTHICMQSAFMVYSKVCRVAYEAFHAIFLAQKEL